MCPNFVNRKRELEFLENKYKEGKRQLIVIYGRRRIGKTELITHFARNREHIYFLANKRGTLANADRFAEKAAKFFNDIKPAVKDFDGVFKYIINRIKNKKLIIVIDEFSYLVEKDPAIPSVFQFIVDEILKKSNVMLILCGSSMSMMEKGVLSYKSPLYGRRTGQWKLNPLNIKATMKFFPDLDMMNMIEFYSVVGDVPAYLIKLDPKKDLFENIRKKILAKGEFLYDEGRNLLMQELREPDTYLGILEAMTKASRPGEIANLARIDAKDLPKYIKNLQKIDIIEKINLITERKPKKTLYMIKDNFIKFWFRFVYPNKSELEENNIDDVSAEIRKNFSQYVGRCFEKFCFSMLKEGYIKIFKFTKISKQWGKFKGEKGKNTYEIDIVALNDKTMQILFAECKWKNNVNASKILQELKEKTNYVEWHKNERKEYYVLFAKSFKNRVEERNVFCFDLNDIEKFLKQKKMRDLLLIRCLH